MRGRRGTFSGIWAQTAFCAAQTAFCAAQTAFCVILYGSGAFCVAETDGILCAPDGILCGPDGIPCGPNHTESWRMLVNDGAASRSLRKNMNALPVHLLRQVPGLSFFSLFCCCFFCVVSCYVLEGFWRAFCFIFDEFLLLFSIKTVIDFSSDFSAILGWILGA